jgi:hypothetical protein
MHAYRENTTLTDVRFNMRLDSLRATAFLVRIQLLRIHHLPRNAPINNHLSPTNPPVLT